MVWMKMIGGTRTRLAIEQVVVFWPIHLLSTRRDRLREEPEAASGEEAGEWPYFLAKTG